MSTKTILAIDGGGIRGLATAVILQAIEKSLPNPDGVDLEQTNILKDKFDLIAGTSTGSILAAGIATGRPISEMIDLYLSQGPIIFKPRFRVITDRVFRTLSQGFSAPLHRDSGLEKVLKAAFTQNGKVIKLGDVNMPLLIQSFDATHHEPVVFKSRSTDKTIRNKPLWEIVKSSCSAPGYFPGHSLKRPSKKRNAAMVDGGVFANNPSLCGIVEIMADGKTAASQIACVSVGSGEGIPDSISPRKSAQMGFAEWGKPLIGIFMGGASLHVHNLTQRLLTDSKYCRFEFISNQSLSLDDASDRYLKQLQKIARDYVEGKGKFAVDEKDKGYDFKSNLAKIPKFCETT